MNDFIAINFEGSQWIASCEQFDLEEAADTPEDALYALLNAILESIRPGTGTLKPKANVSVLGKLGGSVYFNPTMGS